MKFGKEIRIPTYMQSLGQKNHLSISTDKGLEMNNYLLQPNYDCSASGFNT